MRVSGSLSLSKQHLQETHRFALRKNSTMSDRYVIK